MPARAEVEIVASRERDACVIEQVRYQSEGYKILGWIVRPRSGSPWPAIVVSHGSRLSADGQDGSQLPTLSLDAACPPDVQSGHRLYFYPEGRGYGGSGGPLLVDAIDAARDRQEMIGNSIAFLWGRARDVVAGVEALVERGTIRADAIVLTGASHGAVVSLFGAAQSDLFRGAVLQATAVCDDDAACAADILGRVIAEIRIPLLIQKARSDPPAAMDISRRLTAAARRSNPDVQLIEYEGGPDLDGRSFFSARNRGLWERDAFAFYQRLFSSVDRRHAEDPPPAP